MNGGYTWCFAPFDFAQDRLRQAQGERSVIRRLNAIESRKRRLTRRIACDILARRLVSLAPFLGG